MTGPQRLRTSDCWWCNCGKRQSRHHLQGMDPPDQGAVAEGGKGLWVGAPKGASAEMALEGRRCWGSVRVFGEHEGGESGVGGGGQG